MKSSSWGSKLILTIILIAITHASNALAKTPSPAPENKQIVSAQFAEMRTSLDIERASILLLEERLKALEADKADLREDRDRWWRELKNNETKNKTIKYISIISSCLTIIITIASFLWYRKGKLWGFYDSILSQCIEQSKLNSIDTNGWEKIERELYNELQKIFNSLFRFEIIYLKSIINTMIKDQLWIGDGGATTKSAYQITNKENYCKHIVRKTLLSDFRFSGLLLLTKSFKYKFFNKENPDKGYTETLL